MTITNKKQSKYSSKNVNFNNHINLLVENTSKQKEILNFYRDSIISCLTGDPGTGKTFTAIYFALLGLSKGTYEKIVITKPLIETGKSMGYLPGSEAEKIYAYLNSYNYIFEKIIGQNTYKALLNAKKISFEPMNFCRGISYDYSIVICDESQNATLHELVTFATRLSDTSKLILLGDDLQADIRNSGFKTFISLFEGIEGISYKHLGEDFQMRNPLIVNIYKEYKNYLNK